MRHAVSLILIWSVVASTSAAHPFTNSVVVLHEESEDTAILHVALANGDVLRFNLQSAIVMSPALAAKFPGIRTWAGTAEGHPEIKLRFNRSPRGDHLQIFSPHGIHHIDPPPVASHPPESVALAAAEPIAFRCLVPDGPARTSSVVLQSASIESAQVLRTFRFAVAASGEYTQFHGGTVEGAMAGIVTTMNRINGIYERDLGVRLVLVDKNDSLVFTNSQTDPFTSNSPSLTTIQQAQSTFDQVLGKKNYDAGILFNTGTFGLAYLASVCDQSRKGSACIGLPEPAGEQFDIYAAHEISHQFGANHTFNSDREMCGGGRSSWNAVEPGTGSTLLSYAGVPCGNDSFQPLMDGYFHAQSIQEINAVVSSAACAVESWTGNQAPALVAAPAFIIPKLTPFMLSATANDPDGDPLFFSWEQTDIGPAQELGEPDNGASPLFRSFPPGTSAVRMFPRLDALLGNIADSAEKLPAIGRLMRFRVTVRDTAGATAFADTEVQVTDSAGPFRLLSHGEPGFYRGRQTISWDPAGTTNAPINATHVNILLSTNGGKDFSVPLATNVPNDGLATVDFPPIECSSARIRIEAIGNIFFDINDAEISITTSPHFTGVQLLPDSILLRWHSLPGKLYRLETAADLGAPMWTEATIVPVPNGDQMEATVPRTSAPTFFRLVEF